MVEAKSLMASVSPCYLNRIEPIELAFGWGKAIEQAIRIALKKRNIDSNETLLTDLLADCFAPPLHEYKFPRDL